MLKPKTQKRFSTTPLNI